MTLLVEPGSRPGNPEPVKLGVPYGIRPDASCSIAEPRFENWPPRG